MSKQLSYSEEDAHMVTEVEKNIRQALKRLQSGIPQNPVLLKKAEESRLKITIAAVALEAGCSRTLIGLDKCAYPNLRKEVQNVIREHNPRCRSIDKLINELDENVEELRRKVERRMEAYTVLTSRLFKITKPQCVPPRISLVESISNISQKLTKGAQVKHLRNKVRALEKELARYDTDYANILIGKWSANKGMNPDGTPLKPASKEERKKALSIVN